MMTGRRQVIALGWLVYFGFRTGRVKAKSIGKQYTKIQVYKFKHMKMFITVILSYQNQFSTLMAVPTLPWQKMLPLNQRGENTHKGPRV